MNFRKHLFSGIVLQGIGLSLFAQTDKPNIVVIMTDQQRADLCGREGFPMDITPFVDELAHQNAWFDKAYTVMPPVLLHVVPCLPAVFQLQLMYVPITMCVTLIMRKTW